MATAAQIEANRRNAQKSTGPKTDDGKARVRGNALKHGMTAVTLMPGLPQEDPQRLRERTERYLNDFQLRNAAEFDLTVQAASLSLAIERAERIEMAHMTERVRQAVRQRTATVEWQKCREERPPSDPAFNHRLHWREIAARPSNVAEAWGVLTTIVEKDEGRLKELLARNEAIEAVEDPDWADRAALDCSPAFERHRRYQSAKTRELLRTLDMLRKMRNAEWGARNGGWRMPDGGSQMANDKCRMTEGGGQMADGEG